MGGWVILLVALTLSACSGLINAEEARLCRLTLPAIHPDASAITVGAVDFAEPPYSLRVTYRSSNPDRPAPIRFTAASVRTILPHPE